MRKAIWTVLILLVALAAYTGWAVHGAFALLNAVRAGDGAAVIARTDIPALRHSLTTQTIAAYLDALGQNRPVTSRDRLIANTAGAALAATMIDGFLTPDALTELLKSGRVPAAGQPMLIPAFGQIDPGNIWAAAKRIRLVQPTLFAIRTGEPAADGSITEVLMHVSGSSWKLSGLKLPAATLRGLAAQVAKRG